jgi:geranylgeranyl diphosphate synthase type 3
MCLIIIRLKTNKIRNVIIMNIDLLIPYKYTLDIKGNNFRLNLIQLFTSIYKVPIELIDIISEDIASIHTASINIDDIQDGSITRRCKPCCYIIHGVPNTINASYYALFKNLEIIDNKYPSPILQTVLTEIVNLHKGQGFDIVWNEMNYIPKIEEYNEMVNLKTSSLFRLIHNMCYQLGLRKPTNKKRNNDLIYQIGNFFQIRDDYINCCDPNYWIQKGFFEDMNKGKCTYLLIKLNIIDTNFVKKYIFKECNQTEKKIIYNKLFQENVLHEVRNKLLNQQVKIVEILNLYDLNFAEMFKTKLNICPIIEPDKLENYFN